LHGKKHPVQFILAWNWQTSFCRRDAKPYFILFVEKDEKIRTETGSECGFWQLNPDWQEDLPFFAKKFAQKLVLSADFGN
jgi:hypothetical protein